MNRRLAAAKASASPPPASTISRSASSNAREASLSASGSSTTRKCGSSPAAAGWAASRCRQKPWIVEIQARFVASVMAASRSCSSPSALLAHPAAELVGRSLGEGEGEDALGADLLLDRGRTEAIDQHGGLAGAGAGAEEDVAVPRAGRRRLLLGPLAHSSSSSSGPVNSSSGMPRSRRQI